MSYYEVVNYFLYTYEKEELIAEADVSINRFRQSDRMSPPEYAHEWWSKALNFITFYDVARLKTIFIESLLESILQSVQNYWGENPEAYLQDLARHVK